jgi:2-C-methyl-D-erythritol 4-phosphate cytidylyltransferase
MGRAVGKQFMSLRGMPILAHTLGLFEKSPLVDGVVLVIGANQRQILEDEVLGPYPCTKILHVVDGGPERQDSVACGLAVVPPDCEFVVVHDGARPLVTAALLSAVLEAARVHGAALAATAARDTVKLVEDGRVSATLERGGVWLAQTPQAFRVALLRRAYEKARGDGIIATDEAALVERLQVTVRVVPGSEQNIKVTTPVDLVVAEALLAHRDLRRAEGTGHTP